MGDVVAAFGRFGEDVVPYVAKMLNVLGLRDGGGCGVFTVRESAYGKSFSDLLTEEVVSPVCLGYNLSKGREEGFSKYATRIDEFSSFLEGAVFSNSVESLFEKMRTPEESSETQSFLERCDGDFTMAHLKKGGLIIFRDPVGTIPLYLGEDGRMVALSSEKKALWAIGLRDVKPFPPGHLLDLGDKNGEILKSLKKIKPGNVSQRSFEEITTSLSFLIREAVEKRVNRDENLALAFSGGVDSAVLAKILLAEHIPVHLICVGLEGEEREVDQAEDLASELGLRIKIKMFPKEAVEEDVPKVISRIEEADPLKVSLGIPFYWISDEARNLGKTVLMTGQGSDELFGGYLRHMQVYQDEGGEALDRMLLRDVRRAYEVDYELVSHVCAAFNLYHVAPYADFDLITYALGVPAELKMEFEGRILRKAALREVAKEMGLPESAYMRPKKAMQYGTGVDKTLRRVAKDKGLNLRAFLEQKFAEVFPETLKSEKE